MSCGYSEYGRVRLTDALCSRAVADEVLVDDCYRLNELPVGSIVLDGGAFYGEFGLACHINRGCKVMAFEPAAANFAVLQQNLTLNEALVRPDEFVALNVAIADRSGLRPFKYYNHHPAGSALAEHLKVDHVVPVTESFVETSTLTTAIAEAWQRWGRQPTCVKLDCEAAEAEIFAEDASWLRLVEVVTMEWHNYDGDVYAGMLEQAGFTVELEGGGPKPRPKWDKTIGGGLLFARRKV
jgi:FkbM family methyltransferase